MAEKSIDDKYLKRLAEIESSNNPNAKSKTSSAAGLYQFTESTWNDLVSRMGLEYSLDDRFDPNKSKEVVKKFTEENKNYLESRLKRKVVDSELYLAHFLGRSGALNLLSKLDANENLPVNELFSEKALEANKSVFLNEDNTPKTGIDVLNWANEKFGIENNRVSVDPATLNSPEAVKQNETTGFKPEDLPTFQKENYETELQAFLDPIRALQDRPEFKFEKGGKLKTSGCGGPGEPPCPPDHPNFAEINWENQSNMYDPLFEKLMEVYKVGDWNSFLEKNDIHPYALEGIKNVFDYSINDITKGKRKIPAMDEDMKEFQRIILETPNERLRELLKKDYSKVNMFNFKSYLPEELSLWKAIKYNKKFNKLIDQGYTFEEGGQLQGNQVGNQELLTEYNSGGSHENNPLGGIPIGENNLVEQGETRYNDYIFSDSLIVTEDDINRYAFPKRFLNKSYADASKDIQKELEDNPNNKIIINSAQRVLDQLTLANENNKIMNNDKDKKKKKGQQEQPKDTLTLSPFYELYRAANMPNASIEAQTKFAIAKEEMANYFKNVNGNNPRNESMEDHIKRMKLREEAASKKNKLEGGGGLIPGGMSPAGGIGQGISLLSQFMPEDSKAKNPLALAGQGAQLGAMAGPWGAAIGGVAGGIGGLILNSKLKQQQVEAQNKDALMQSNQFDNKFKYGGKLYAEGGPIDPNNPPYPGWRPWHKPENHWQKYKNGKLILSGKPYSIRGGEVFLTSDLPDVQQPSQADIPDSLRQTENIPVTGPVRLQDQFNNYTNTGNNLTTTGNMETGRIRTDLPILGTGQDININPVDAVSGTSNNSRIPQRKVQQSVELTPEAIQAANSGPVFDNSTPSVMDEFIAPSNQDVAQGNSSSSFLSNLFGGKNTQGSGFDAGNLLRYAPTIGNTIRLLNAPGPEVESLNRLDNRYQRDLVDERRLERNASEAASNTRRALLNASAGSASAARSSLLGSQINESRALSEAMMQADNVNRQENQIAQQFNLGVDNTNLAQDNAEKQINAQNRAAAQANKDMLLNSILGDLGNIGREKELNSILEKVAGYNYKGKKINSLGGMLDQMKHHRGDDIKELIKKRYGY